VDTRRNLHVCKENSLHEKGNLSTHGEEISLDREEFFNIKREIILYLKRNYSLFKEKFFL